MNAGTLNCIIHIYERTQAQQPSGFMAVTETPLFTLRASRSDATTREIWEAMAAKARNVVNWEIRYKEGVMVGQWLEWKGQWHEIIAVQRPAGIPARMILKTTLKESRG